MIRIHFSACEQGLAELLLLAASYRRSCCRDRKGTPLHIVGICQANAKIIRAILHKEVWDADDQLEMESAMARLDRLTQHLPRPVDVYALLGVISID